MKRRRIIRWAIYLFAGLLCLESGVVVPVPVVQAAGNTYYVSVYGNNADGTSWATAWSELDQINWDMVDPGDTILVDGGATECLFPVQVTGESNTPSGPTSENCGQVYQSSLVLGASGEANNPITIKVADEAGRNGTVKIFGGRSTPLPYCGQVGYEWQSEGVNLVGIDTSSAHDVVIDGSKWAGFMVYGHNRYGIELDSSTRDVLIRNVEVFDNGNLTSGGDPDQKGVNLSGTRITVERAIIHDNGQDAFQSGGGVADFTLRRSWLYNRRSHPFETDEPFNHCRHTDGIQIYNGGDQSGLLVEDSIIGPGLMQGFILGDHAHAGAVATIHDVTVRNSLLVSHHGSTSNAGLITKYDPNAAFPNSPPTNYTFDHVTIVRDINTCLEHGQSADQCPGATWWNAYVMGSGHRVIDSIFWGGTNLRVLGVSYSLGNFRWRVNDNSDLTTEADPMFVDAEYGGVGEGFADFDFSVQNAVLQGAGSSISSVAALLDLGAPTPTPQPTATTEPTQTPTSTPTTTPTPSPSPTPNLTQTPTVAPTPGQTPTVTPAPTLTPTATPVPVLGLSMEAEDGQLSLPLQVGDSPDGRTVVYQTVESTDPAQGGTAAYHFGVSVPGEYSILAVVYAPDRGSNSFFVGLDGDVSAPAMIWDIAPTHGFEERVVSWRGTGDSDVPQYSPKLFYLSAGEHELTIVGREGNTLLDRITITPFLAGMSDKVYLPMINP